MVNQNLSIKEKAALIGVEIPFTSTSTTFDERERSLFIMGSILEICANTFPNIANVEVLKGISRRQDFVFARTAFYRIVYRDLEKIVGYNSSISTTRLGAFVNRDHATVINALRSHDNMVSTNYAGYLPFYIAAFDSVSELLGGRFEALLLEDRINNLSTRIDVMIKIRDSFIKDLIVKEIQK